MTNYLSFHLIVFVLVAFVSSVVLWAISDLDDEPATRVVSWVLITSPIWPVMLVFVILLSTKQAFISITRRAQD